MTTSTADGSPRGRSVSVIVVNLDGADLLPECLDSVAAQDWPCESMETLVVDNGSRDASLAMLATRYPWVRTIALGRNAGFAEANNIAAEAARGEVLVLLNNDARADPGFVRELVAALGAPDGPTCAGARMLDWTGERIDFAGGALNLYGRAFQLGTGLPADDPAGSEAGPALFACGGAMAILRSVFLDVGGFDASFGAYFEDVDLGWRLWLLGHEVTLVPTAVALHRQHATGGRRFPVEQRYALAEANALRMLVKNLDDDNLARVLPLALLLAVKRALAQAGVDRQAYRLAPIDPVDMAGGFDPAAGATESEPAMTRVATGMLVGIEALADELPEMLAGRARVQSRRRISDSELFARFPLRADNPIFPWRNVTVAQNTLAEAFGIPAPLRPRPGRRLLLVTHETIGERMAGPAARALEIARALSGDVDVTLAARGQPTWPDDGPRIVGYDPEDPYYRDLDPYLASTDAVMALAPLWWRIPRLRDLDKPAIVDLYDPFVLEKLTRLPGIAAEHHPGIDLDSAVELSVALSTGDFFVCAGERQRDLWLGALMAAGRVNSGNTADDPRLRGLIDIVAFGLPDSPPSPGPPAMKGVLPGIGVHDQVVLWNGGLWPWLDAETVLRAMALVTQRRSDVHLVFAAGEHFDARIVPDMGAAREARELAARMGLEHRTHFLDWIPYADRGRWLLEADVAACTARDSLENRYAWRTRLLDCVWCGLPVAATGGDPLTQWLGRRGLAAVVPPTDAAALATALLGWLDAPTRRSALAEAFASAADELAWSRQVAPLRRFMQEPRFAADARTAAGALERGVAVATGYEARLERMAGELEAARSALRDAGSAIEEQRRYIGQLERHIDAIASGKVMRVLSRFGRGGERRR